MNFRELATRALLAGLAAGLVFSALTLPWGTHLILEAEVYEEALPADHDHAGDDHHGHEEWAPQGGLERNLYTVLSAVLMGMGYGLVLAGLMALAGAGGLRQGLLWGLGGYLSAWLLPALGLPPELPGMQAADLFARQSWWLFTAIASAGGLALLFRARAWGWRLAGATLLLLPHLVGAPQPPVHAGAVPEDLVHRFWVASAVTNLAFWLTLGAVTGHLLRQHTPAPRPA